MTTRPGLAVLSIAALAGAAHAADFTLSPPLGLEAQAAYVPEDNPLTAEKIALGDAQQWTGARPTLEDQAMRASDQSPELLGKTLGPIREYPEQFRKVFGTEVTFEGDLIAFLHALTGHVAAEVASPPRLPE